MTPTITVVIPAYNREKEIKASIESVLRQTYHDLEVIVVDDGSQDRTAAVVNELSQKDPRLRPCVRLPKNGGACHARNVGADLAKGEYIAFQDSDDIWLPDKLAHQLSYLQKGSFDLVFCRLKRITVSTGRYVYWPDHPYNDRKDALQRILFASPTGTQCLLMKASLFQQVRFDENIRLLDDWDFMIRAAQAGKIGYLKETQVLSYLLEKSITKSSTFSESYAKIYHKYESLILPDPFLHARFEERTGDGYFRRDPSHALVYYRNSMRIHPQPRTLGKMILATGWRAWQRIRQ